MFSLLIFFAINSFGTVKMKEETSRQTGELALISSLFDNVRASIKSLPSRGTLEQNMIKALSDLQSTKKKIFYFFLVF